MRRGGLAAGVLALGSVAGSSAARAATTQTATTTLDPARRATYARLAETVLTGPSMRLGASAAGPATAEFGTIYALWPAQDRKRADQLLDRLARLDAKGREKALKPPGLARQETELAEQALALVALVTGASDDVVHPVVTL
jgi:hypothetical protein